MADRIVRVIEGNPQPYLNALQKSSEATRRFGAAQNAEFTKVAASFKGILGGFGFASLGLAAIRSSDQISLGLRKIRVGAGTTGASLKGLETTFDNVFARVPQDAEEVGSAISVLSRILGANGDDLQKLSLQVLNASRLMGEDGAGNATLFARAMNQFSEPAQRGAEVLDTLFNVSQRTGVGFGELLNATNEYGSVLKNAGFTIEESAELFGRLSSAGISVSRVAPGLNSAFRNWAKEGKNSREELARVVEQMQNAANESAALAIATDAFGAEGAQRLTTAVRSGRLELEGLTGASEDAKGAIDSANKATTTWSEALAVLSNKLAVVGSAISASRFVDFLESVSKSKVEQDIEGLSRALGVAGDEIRHMPFDEMIREIEASGDVVTKFGTITTTRMKQLAEAIRDARQEASLFEELDLVASGIGGRNANQIDAPGGGGGGGPAKKKTAADRALEKRLESLDALELEFLNAESVRTFEADRTGFGEEISSFDFSTLVNQFEDIEALDIPKAVDNSKELERIWDNIGGSIGEASISLIDGLVRGTLGWQGALQLVLREVLSIVSALSQVQGGGSSGVGIASTIFGAIGSIAGSISPSSIGDFSGATTAPFRPTAEGGIFAGAQLRTIAEAGPEAVIPLDRMGDVMQDIAPFNHNAISSRISSDAERPIIVEVAFNGTTVEPSSFKSTPDEQWDVLVNGIRGVARVRDAIGQEISRRNGRG